MSKKTLKLISIVTIILSVVMVGVTCFADDVTPGQITGTGTGVQTGIIVNAGNQIAAIIRTVGIVASVIILMILGIKYMMGSAEEKADYKKTMIPYVVGAVVLFGASALAGAIVELAQGITGA